MNAILKKWNSDNFKKYERFRQMFKTIIGHLFDIFQMKWYKNIGYALFIKLKTI